MLLALQEMSEIRLIDFIKRISGWKCNQTIARIIQVHQISPCKRAWNTAYRTIREQVIEKIVLTAKFQS